MVSVPVHSRAMASCIGGVSGVPSPPLITGCDAHTPDVKQGASGSGLTGSLPSVAEGSSLRYVLLQSNDLTGGCVVWERRAHVCGTAVAQPAGAS
jgi:hypothetical protein